MSTEYRMRPVVDQNFFYPYNVYTVRLSSGQTLALTAEELEEARREYQHHRGLGYNNSFEQFMELRVDHRALEEDRHSMSSNERVYREDLDKLAHYLESKIGRLLSEYSDKIEALEANIKELEFRCNDQDITIKLLMENINDSGKD